MDHQNRPGRRGLLSLVPVLTALSCSGTLDVSASDAARVPTATPGAARERSGPTTTDTAAARMLQAGPEENELHSRTGTWDVVATMWPAPGAAPVVTRGLIAERTMIGPILQEIMHPAPGSAVPDFRRLDYLNFDRVEGRWKYVSMDTRMPVSIMPAWSFGPAQSGRITVQFAGQAFVGFGTQVEGRFLVSDMQISRTDLDHETKEQHFNLATGDGTPWLFIQYAYTRRH